MKKIFLGCNILYYCVIVHCIFRIFLIYFGFFPMLPNVFEMFWSFLGFSGLFLVFPAFLGLFLSFSGRFSTFIRLWIRIWSFCENPRSVFGRCEIFGRLPWFSWFFGFCLVFVVVLEMVMAFCEILSVLLNFWIFGGIDNQLDLSCILQISQWLFYFFQFIWM